MSRPRRFTDAAHGSRASASLHDASCFSPVAPAAVTEGGVILSFAPRQTSCGPSFGVKPEGPRLSSSVVSQATCLEVSAGTKRGREVERNSSAWDSGHRVNVLVRDAEKTGKEAMALSKTETESGEEEDWNLYGDSTPPQPCNDDDLLDDLLYENIEVSHEDIGKSPRAQAVL